MKYIILFFFSLIVNGVLYSQTNYSALINKSTSSAEYADFINSISEKASVKTFDNGWKYFSFYKTGIEILIINDKINTVFFKYKKDSKFNTFSGSLPQNITWGMTKALVHEKVGAPSQTGGGGEFLGKPVFYWDKYAYANYALHISYKENTVYEVSIMTLIKP